MLDNDILDEDILRRIKPDTPELLSTQLFQLEIIHSASGDIVKEKIAQETRFRITEERQVNKEQREEGSHIPSNLD